MGGSRLKGTVGDANEGIQLGIEKNFSGLRHQKYLEKKHVQVALLRVEFKVAWFFRNNNSNNNSTIYLKLACRIAKANKHQLYTTYNDN